MSPPGDTIAKIRPQARELGYRFASATLEQGAYGPYQRVVVSRVAGAN
jgi:hypothetical protein